MVRATVRATLVVLSIVVVSCVSSPGDRITDDPRSSVTSGGRTLVMVVEVTDGDTIRVDLSGRQTPVRLIGIDTPETDGPYTDEECFGEAASRFATGALEGREIELEFDVERTDRFDRTLAYVWLDGQLFNERMLVEGYAVFVTFPPNVRYVDRLTEAERRGRNEGAGLWSACRAG